MVALAQCPVIQEHDAHDWSFKLVIDGEGYVPKYFHCHGVNEYLHIEVETNPELFEKLIGRTQEEQPEASPERIIGEDKRAEEFKVTPGSIFTLPQPDFQIRPDIEALGFAIETMVVSCVGGSTLDRLFERQSTFA